MKDPIPNVETLIGKTVLIGITRLDHDGELIEQRQHVGTFASMDGMIHVTLAGGEEFTLPPDLSAFRKAQPGIYRLRSTGEEIENPDFVASWTVRASSPSTK